jgi:transcriptional regulator with XRE-family HTH domain
MPTSRSRTFLREWRKVCHLTQIQAAERVGIRQSTLSKIERGQLPYDQDFLERAALAYGAHEAADLLTIDPTLPRETDIIHLLRHAPPEAKRIIMLILRTGTSG